MSQDIALMRKQEDTRDPESTDRYGGQRLSGRVRPSVMCSNGLCEVRRQFFPTPALLWTELDPWPPPSFT